MPKRGRPKKEGHSNNFRILFKSKKDFNKFSKLSPEERGALIVKKERGES